MSGSNPPSDDGLASGSASMRDSAKWLVGGVAATAAGVYAGSSLTNLGSLSFTDQPMRLGTAICGAVLGFIGLGWIVKRAIAVLTVDTVTFRELAEAEASEAPGPLKELAAKMVAKHSLPIKATSLTEVMTNGAELQAASPDADEVRKYRSKVIRHAAFLRVKERFDNLTGNLIPATILSLLGFGLFAWAANPPEREKSPAARGGFSVTVFAGDGKAATGEPPPQPQPCGSGSCPGRDRSRTK